jgi:hypothetical protein
MLVNLGKVIVYHFIYLLLGLNFLLIYCLLMYGVLRLTSQIMEIVFMFASLMTFLNLFGCFQLLLNLMSIMFFSNSKNFLNVILIAKLNQSNLIGVANSDT